MMSKSVLICLLTAGAILFQIEETPLRVGGSAPGSRVLLDAHNAFPENSAWTDRIDRALSGGFPLAIEQDLVWHKDPVGGGRSIVSHGEPFDGHEPSLEDHFFKRIQPSVERALLKNDVANWPLITLNLDFKTNEREHVEAVLALLRKYEAWLTSAVRSQGVEAAPLNVRPVLVLTGSNDMQEAVFHHAIPMGERILAFGAVSTASPRDENQVAAMPPHVLVTGHATNYRRWWNNSWAIVEAGGPPKASDWSMRDRDRLRMLVDHAHDRGLWIRFYTLNGHEVSESQGWNSSYDFGSLQAARLRWRAAIQAGADFVATDQYEQFRRELQMEGQRK
jgi:hypothetical protein